MGRKLRVLLKETCVLDCGEWVADHHVWVVLSNCIDYDFQENGSILFAKDADGREFCWPASNVLAVHYEGAELQDA